MTACQPAESWSSPIPGSRRSTWSARSRCSRRPTGSGRTTYAVEVAARRRRSCRVDERRRTHRVTADRRRARTARHLVVAGGEGTVQALRDRSLVETIRRLADRSRRVTSVCSGAFLLAEAGLLDGRRATTHWSVCDVLARLYPAVDVDPEPIYVRDGNTYTSAGVTAGMDLALALVEDDLGRDVALARRAPAGALPAAAGQPGAVQRATRSATRAARRRPRGAALDHRTSRRRSDGQRARNARTDERAILRALVRAGGRSHSGSLCRTSPSGSSPTLLEESDASIAERRSRTAVRHRRDHAAILPACVAYWSCRIPPQVLGSSRLILTTGEDNGHCRSCCTTG